MAILAAATVVGLLSAPAQSHAASLLPRDCSNSPDPCIRYCFIGDETKVPCGLGGPNLTGTATFSAPLSAAAQDATGIPGDPGASGTSNITLNLTSNQLCATTTWSGIDSKVVAGHIHGGQAGKPENPAITLNLFSPDFVNGVQSGASGCMVVPAEVLYAIRKCPAQFSLVVHSFNNPVGAIRGQVGTTCDL